MSREKEVNIIVDAKNKSKGTFLEVSKDLKGIGNSAREGMSNLASSLDGGINNIKRFTDKLGFMDKAVQKTFKGAAAMGGVYVASTLRDFSKLNSGIANVNTLYDQTAESQKKMYDDSIKMLKMLPTDFDNITGATYDAISAGADPKYATMFARKFGMGAVAGNADMPVVTKAAMGTMNAYKLEAKDLNNILDLQFMTVKDGITSYDELASSLGTGILANAQSAGVTLEELYGSIAMITKNAIPANVATTSLMQLFNQFTNTKTIEEFKGFGVAIQDANHKTRPLVEIFKDLNLQFEKKNFTSEQRKGFLKEMLGSDEASRAIMPLLGDMEEFQRILGNMDKSDGAMKGAFEDQLESVSVQAKLMWNNIKGYGVENVTALKPFMDSLLEPFLKKQKLQFELAELQDKLAMTEGHEIKLKISDLEQQIKEEFDRELSEGFKLGVNPEIKNEKIVKLKSEVAELEKQLKDLDETEGGKARKELEKQILEIETKIEEIDMSPVEAFRDGLAEGVANLEKINPPLAKFVDTVGSLALSFVGEEGKTERTVAKGVGGVVLGAYGFKKIVDMFAWFSKNFGGKDKDGKGIGDSLAMTMKTMNVQAGVVNVYGGKGVLPGNSNIPGNNTGGNKPPLAIPGGKGTPRLPGGSKTPGLISRILNKLGNGTKTVGTAVASNPIAAATIVATAIALYKEKQKSDKLNDYNEDPQKYTFDEKNNLVTKDHFDNRLSNLKNTRPEYFEGATIQPNNGNKIKTSKEIQTAKDSSEQIKTIVNSMSSFTKTMKDLAIKPEITRPGPVKKDSGAESFLMKEINRVTEVDNKISLQNDINVAAPPVTVSVNIDGKNIPSNTNVNSSALITGFMKQMEIMSRRTGK